MPSLEQPITKLDAHIDPDTLAAFAKNALNKQEIAQLFVHVEHCERCRDLMSVHARLRSFEWAPVKFLVAVQFYDERRQD